MARGNSSRASSEFFSVRARAYPGIWEQKTKDAIAQNIDRDGETFKNEAYFAQTATERVARILKNELPAHSFVWADVVKTKTGYRVDATFAQPGSGYIKRGVSTSFDTQEQADAIAQHLSEGMDLTENGRPLNLRRMPDETEDQKELDAKDRRRAASKAEKVAEKRESERNYAAFVQKVKDDMEKERKARLNK
jgi:hypothetical protein